MDTPKGLLVPVIKQVQLKVRDEAIKNVDLSSTHRLIGYLLSHYDITILRII